MLLTATLGNATSPTSRPTSIGTKVTPLGGGTKSWHSGLARHRANTVWMVSPSQGAQCDFACVGAAAREEGFAAVDAALRPLLTGRGQAICKDNGQF